MTLFPASKDNKICSNIYCRTGNKAVTKLLYFAQEDKSFIWANRRNTYISELTYKKNGRNKKNCIEKNKFATYFHPLIANPTIWSNTQCVSPFCGFCA